MRDRDDTPMSRSFEQHCAIFDLIPDDWWVGQLGGITALYHQALGLYLGDRRIHYDPMWLINPRDFMTIITMIERGDA